MLGIDGKIISQLTTMDILIKKTVKLQENSCKILYRNTKVPLFCEIVYNILSKVAWGNIFSSLFWLRLRGIYIFDIILAFQKIHSLFKLIFRASELPQRPKFDMFQEALFWTSASSPNLILKGFQIK